LPECPSKASLCSAQSGAGRLKHLFIYELTPLLFPSIFFIFIYGSHKPVHSFHFYLPCG
jgi:hypothetical protein